MTTELKAKRITARLQGLRVLELEIMPGSKIQDLLDSLHLNGDVPWNVSSESGEFLSSETELYSRVREGEQVFIAPSAPVG